MTAAGAAVAAAAHLVMLFRATPSDNVTEAETETQTAPVETGVHAHGQEAG